MMKGNQENEQMLSKKTIVVVSLVVIACLILWTTTEVLQAGFELVKRQISGSAKPLVTYYQWTNSSKELIISRSPPTGNQAYISFQGSDDLRTVETIPTTQANAEGIDNPPIVDKVLRTSFQCDGRQYCSQMTSRAEAIYFIKNCPNIKMDGDNDGIPCENDSRF